VTTKRKQVDADEEMDEEQKREASMKAKTKNLK
jgi:hypothetical protein